VAGYDTNLGFIPHVASNKLYELFKASTEAGECVIKDPVATEAGEARIDALIFCAVLDQGWQHLAGPLARQFEYLPHEHATPIKLNVRIRNLPTTPEDVLPHVFTAMGVEAPPWTIPVRLRALQTGMIEIEVSVDSLQKLFRNERGRVRKWIEPFLADSLAKHYIRTARDECKGPGIDWLIANAQFFLTYAVADIANVALQAFDLEYGGVVPGHVAEDALLRSTLSFARCADGKVSVHRFQHQGEHSFGLAGQWQTGSTLLRLTDEELRKQLDLHFVASRVRQLFGAGFAMEALVVANAAFEVALEGALVGAVTADGKARKLMIGKGHRYRLELLNKIVAAKTEAGLDTTEFSDFLSALTKSNSMRNDYLHQLVMPTDNFWKLAQLDRTVEHVLPFITDPHLSMITLGRLIGLARTARSETVALLLSELQRLKEWCAEAPQCPYPGTH
jgi:hypothetical protein